MGWTNSHLHRFAIGKRPFRMANVDGAVDLWLEDERKYRVQDLLKSGASVLYEYDFGDSWEHVVTVKKITNVDKAPQPRCTGGARAPPPGDSGGADG